MVRVFTKNVFWKKEKKKKECLIMCHIDSYKVYVQSIFLDITLELAS